MNKVYDNGHILLGTKKDIIDITKKNIEHFKEIGDDYVVDTCNMILDELKYYNNTNDNTIFAIDYDSSMGVVVEYWNESDTINDRGLL